MPNNKPQQPQLNPAAPLSSGLTVLGSRPFESALFCLLMLTPLLFVVAGGKYLVNQGLVGALQQLAEGSIPSQNQSLIGPPGPYAIKVLAATGALITFACAVIASAAVITGISSSTPADGSGRLIRLKRCLALWPRVTLSLSLQLGVTSTILGAVGILLGVVSRSLNDPANFEVPNVLWLATIVLLFFVVFRFSLWLAFALTYDKSVSESLSQAWNTTRGNLAELLAAAVTVTVVFLGPAWALSKFASWVLTQLDDLLLLPLAPQTVDLISWLMYLPFVVAGIAVWAAGSREFVNQLKPVSS